MPHCTFTQTARSKEDHTVQHPYIFMQMSTLTSNQNLVSVDLNQTHIQSVFAGRAYPSSLSRFGHSCTTPPPPPSPSHLHTHRGSHHAPFSSLLYHAPSPSHLHTHIQWVTLQRPLILLTPALCPLLLSCTRPPPQHSCTRPLLPMPSNVLHLPG